MQTLFPKVIFLFFNLCSVMTIHPFLLPKQMGWKKVKYNSLKGQMTASLSQDRNKRCSALDTNKCGLKYLRIDEKIRYVYVYINVWLSRYKDSHQCRPHTLLSTTKPFKTQRRNSHLVCLISLCCGCSYSSPWHHRSIHLTHRILFSFPQWHVKWLHFVLYYEGEQTKNNNTVGGCQCHAWNWFDGVNWLYEVNGFIKCDVK